MLAKKVAEILAKSPMHSLLSALTEAQQIFPADKRRNIASTTMLPWLKDMVDDAMQKTQDLHGLKLQAELDAAQALNTEYAEKLKALEERIANVDAHVAMTTVMSSFSIEDIATNIGRSIMDRFITEQLEAQELLVMPPITVNRRTRKLRIVVAGLLPGQIRLIDSKFNEVFDLRFWKVTEPIAMLKSTLVSADHVVVLTKFVNHSVTEVTSQHNHILIPGGLSSLRETLVGLT